MAILSTSKPSFVTRIGRIIYNTVVGFIDDDCYSKASALTFYSLLSIVPIVAVAFGIGKGFGFDTNIEQELTKAFAEQPQVAEKLIGFARSWLENVQGGLIAGVGTILLLWTVMGLFGNVESAFNAIWKVKTPRPYIRRVSDYLAAVIIAPLFFVASSSINIFITTQLTETAHQNVLFEAINPLLLSLLKLFPYILTWILFSFVYLFMPNTRVFFRTAVMAGILAGSAFQLWQWLYIKFQIGVASYGAIYGSFAALPLFLIWLQISWVIVLAGAELAVQLENDAFIPNRLIKPVSNKAAALYITYYCLDTFFKGKEPLTDRTLAKDLCLSLNHAQGLLKALVDAKILSEVSMGYRAIGYQPAKPAALITMKSVCDAIDSSSYIQGAPPEDAETGKIEEYLLTIDSQAEEISKRYPLYSPEKK